MNRRALIVIALSFLYLLPYTTSAHGGFEKRAGDTVVYITQFPTSPLVGEVVSVNLVFQKYDSLERWKGLDVTLNIIDTFYGDESRDTLLETRNYTTDANGSINFTYTFQKENYFDIDISFNNPITQQREETGFLIQPRAMPSRRTDTLILSGIAIFLTTAIGLYMQRRTVRFHASVSTQK